MFNVRQMSAPLSRKDLPENSTPDDILNAFLDYLTATNTEPYDHQEEAILELFAGNNVILNTPTGSGKSLVALALQFKSLCQGRRSYYTVPIKALANEKFLCHVLGPENVGMTTGDATSYGPRNSFRLLVSSRASVDETSSSPVRWIQQVN